MPYPLTDQLPEVDSLSDVQDKSSEKDVSTVKNDGLSFNFSLSVKLFSVFVFFLHGARTWHLCWVFSVYCLLWCGCYVVVTFVRL